MMHRARAALAAEFGVPVGRIRDDTSVVRELGIDSLDWLRLVFALEDEFDVSIPADFVIGEQRFRPVVERLLAGALPREAIELAA
jgi:acyl carrier protein